MKKQKDIFLESEADAWIERNLEVLESAELDLSHPVLKTIAGVVENKAVPDNMKVLEIGCGEGSRLRWIADNWGAEVYGLDPSARAIELAGQKSVNATRGTADDLPFEDGMFDIVIFGFCLYLCDREDLFTIAAEANRVLKQDGWIVVHDFYSKFPQKRPYHHYEGVFSYKMDCRNLFDWHPHYICFSHLVIHHRNSVFTDDSNEWEATSLFRKHTGFNV